jgi:hypothetical protein
MRKIRRTLTMAVVAAACAAGLAAAPQARAVAEPEGCCCLPSPEGMKCSPSSEKDCLAKQKAAPKYDEKTGWDEALAESKAQEAGKMTSGWRAGACAAQ